LLVALVVVMAAAACGSSGDPEFRTVSGLASLPNQSLEDWVSYGDAVAVVRIASEEGESSLSAEEQASGEGLTVRHVTAAVESIVWTAAGRTADPPSTFSIDAPGWIYSDSGKHPYVMEDGNRLEVGEKYLMPIGLFDADGWKPIGFGVRLTDDDLLRVDAADQRTAAEQGPAGVEPAATLELSGLTVDTAAAKIAATAPDPVAKQFADLDPQARFREVTRAEHAAEGSRAGAPGES
jgi:hypothetical protein